jgi:hypothetical protein
MTDAPERIVVAKCYQFKEPDDFYVCHPRLQHPAGVEYIRADIHAEAIEAAEQRGYARGIKAAVEKMRRLSGKLDILACEDVLQIADDLSALSPTPPAPAPVTVQEAARAWKAAREAAMKNVTPETFTELSKAESALSRALAQKEGE